MFPWGMRGRNPKQMEMMMRRMGIKMDEMKNVEVVVIKMPDKEIVIHEPVVMKIVAQGQESFQISGRSEEIIKGGEEKLLYTVEDLRIVMEQTGATEDEAREALEKCEGQPAEAILYMMEKKELE